MKERPILMTPANAQKCHDGTKTQTRRIIKNQPGEFVHIEYDERTGWQYWWDVGVSGMPDVRQEYAPLKCPYGIPGDRLWVREPFCTLTTKGHEGEILYRGQCDEFPSLKPIWKPSIHMPRTACRTVLEITEIRVQRLQEIREEDAKAEGAQFHDGRGIGHSGWRHDFKDVHADARSSFVRLWESINGPGSWAENPWVWCVSFKRVQP